MSATEQLMSVAQVCELQPGDEQNATWINPGFTGVVRSISKKAKKAGGFFFPCVIADTTGSATIEVSFFTAPKFNEGDQIELSGSGLRRTEFNGKAQAAIGKATEVHVIGKSVHHEEQVERAATGAPAVNGTPQPVNGQTVGMAMKEALTLVITSYRETKTEFPDIKKPAFWGSVHEVASDIIRVARRLEMGKLAPPVRERNGEAPPSTTRATAPTTGGRADPAPRAAGKPAPGPDGSAYDPKASRPELEEDVPFN